MKPPRDRSGSNPRVECGGGWPRIVGALAGACALLANQPAAAEEAYYAGKTINIVVGFSPGGGFDVFARLLARHLGNFVPGKPAVVVRNMPGAGTMTAIRSLGGSLPSDGTNIVAFHYGLIGQSQLTPERVPLDFRNFSWLGSISQDVSICYTRSELGIRTLAELRARKGLNFGLTGLGTNDDIFARILKGVFAVDLRQIGGYPGSADVRLAVERGELDGHCGSWGSVPTEWMREKRINPVFRTAEFVPPDMPADIPYMMDAVDSERDRAIIRLLVSDRLLGRPYIMSPLVPTDRLEILRTAFMQTMRDPAFRADAENVRQPVAAKDARQSRDIVEAIYATKGDVVAAARQMLQ